MAVSCVAYRHDHSKPELNNCRLCFAKDLDLIGIFEECGSYSNVAQTIQETLNYKVEKGDQFPPHICLDCLHKLNDFRDFKRKCDSRKRTYELILSARADNLKPVCTKIPEMGKTKPVKVVKVSTGKENDLNASLKQRNRPHASRKKKTSRKSLLIVKLPGLPWFNDSPISQRRRRSRALPKSVSRDETTDSPVNKDSPFTCKSKPERNERPSSRKSLSLVKLPGSPVCPSSTDSQLCTPKRERCDASPKGLSPGQQPVSSGRWLVSPVPQDSSVSQELAAVIQRKIEGNDEVSTRQRKGHASPKAPSLVQRPVSPVSHHNPVSKFPVPKMDDKEPFEDCHALDWSSNLDEPLIPAEMVEVVTEELPDLPLNVKMEVVEEADWQNANTGTPSGKSREDYLEETVANRDLEWPVMPSESVWGVENPWKVLMPLNEEGQFMENGSDERIATEIKKAKKREYYQRKLAKETPEEKALRLEKIRQRRKRLRERKREEKKKRDLAQSQSESIGNERIAMEMKEKAEKREYESVLAKETEEERALRLEKVRQEEEMKAQKKAVYERKMAKETPEQRAARLEKMRQRHKRRTPEERQRIVERERDLRMIKRMKLIAE